MEQNTDSLIRRSVVAGILIGLGDIIYAQVDNPVIGSLLFSFGLLSVIALSLPLYTGKIGFTDFKNHLYLLKVLYGNLLGVAFAVFLVILANPKLETTFIAIAEAKMSKDFIQIFVCGMFCGALIHFAVKIKQSITTIMAIMIFILIGAEHCIAIFPYVIIKISFASIGKLILVILGNSVGAIAIERAMK